MRLDEIVVQRSRWRLAALKVELKLLRLRLTVRAYNPGQPRVPAGQPDGGQWTREGGSGGHGTDDDARLILVGSDDDQRYKVDLRVEEGRGGTRWAGTSASLTTNYLNGSENLNGGRFSIMAANGEREAFHRSIPQTHSSMIPSKKTNQKSIL